MRLLICTQANAGSSPVFGSIGSMAERSIAPALRAGTGSTCRRFESFCFLHRFQAACRNLRRMYGSSQRTASSAYITCSAKFCVELKLRLHLCGCTRHLLERSQAAKTADFDSAIRRFDSFRSSQIVLQGNRVDFCIPLAEA